MKVGTLVRNWIVRALFLLIAAPIALFVMMTVLWCAIQALMPGGNQYMFANVYLFLPIVLGGPRRCPRPRSTATGGWSSSR